MSHGQEFLEKMPIIEAITIVFRYIDPIEHYPMHNRGRSHHGILYVLEGSEHYTTSSAMFRTEPGDVVYLPKSDQYDVVMSDPCCTVICIDFETCGPFQVPAFQLRPMNSRLFKGLFMEAERIWQNKRIGWEMECMSMTYRIIAEMQRQILMKYLQSETLERIQPGVDFLHQHFNEANTRVELLAEKCRLHPRYFAKVFRDAYGVSPKQYMTQLRMERARELILSNRYTMSQIAQMTGFGDIYHFSKTFKQENGISPTEYSRNGEVHR